MDCKLNGFLNLVIIFFKRKDVHKDNRKRLFEHRYLHTLAKSVLEERIELPSLSVKVRNLTAKLFENA